MAINQSFRRDLFLRGVASSTPGELRQRINRVMLRLLEAPSIENYSFNTSFGQVSGSAERYTQVEQGLAHGPRSFGQLLEDTGIALPELAKIISLLLHAGRIGLDRSACADGNRAHHVNDLLLALILEGRPYGHLVAPGSGGAVDFSLVEALILDGQRRHLGGQALEQHLQEGLAGLGRSLQGPADEKVRAFTERQPRLQALGVLP
jgi:hypothetical protein